MNKDDIMSEAEMNRTVSGPVKALNGAEVKITWGEYAPFGKPMYDQDPVLVEITYGNMSVVAHLSADQAQALADTIKGGALSSLAPKEKARIGGRRRNAT
nr:MAG TPA: hypothetical protein [Caudoviricetes sp.]